MGFAKPIATDRSVTGMPTGRLAVWWVVASEIVIFGGVLGSYLIHRIGHPEFGLDAIHTNVWAGGFNTLVLLTSSYRAVLAHNAAEQGDGKKASKLLWFTILGGLIFLCVKSYEWNHEIELGYTITAGMFCRFTTSRRESTGSTSLRVCASWFGLLGWRSKVKNCSG